MIRRFRAASAKRRDAAKPHGRWLWLWLTALPTGLLLSLHFTNTQLQPIIASTAQAIATRAATEALNRAVTDEIAHDMDFHKIVQIDDEDKKGIAIARFDLAAVSHLQAQATERAEQNLRQLEQQALLVPLGQVFGGALFTAFGPDLPIHVLTVGSVHSAVTADVKSVGINQAVHILYLNMTAEVAVVAPFVRQSVTADTKVPMAYVVFTGKVPQTYLGAGRDLAHPVVPPVN